MKASYKFIDQEYNIFKYTGIDWQKYVTFWWDNDDDDDFLS